MSELSNSMASRLIGLLEPRPHRWPRGVYPNCDCPDCRHYRLARFGSADKLRTVSGGPSSAPGAVGAPWGDDRAAFAVAGMSWRAMSESDPTMQMVLNHQAYSALYPLQPNLYGDGSR